MSSKVNLPRMGMGIEEGTILKWLKKVGDHVEEGEPLVEIETAKATQEVPALVSGTLVEILVAEGATVPVNSDLALIDECHD
jgi:pyruvate/2-oxoglutarate dehydrogenase complex dihydrolipoamide acyltransferase (E2) component